MNNLTQTKIWKIRLSSIVWYTLIVLSIISLPLVLNISVWLLPILIIISLIIASVILIIRKFIKHDWSLSTFIKSTLFFALLLTVLCATPVLYFAIITQLHPTLLPQVTLTNGKKNVIFQGMQHVGSEEFYKSVVYDLEDALSRDYVLLYEGVQPGTPESEKWFNDTFAQGQQNISSGYETIGKTCGLKFQGAYFQLFEKDMSEKPDKFINADVTTTQLKQKYDELVKNDPAFAKAMQQRQQESQVPENRISTSIIENLTHGNKKQQFITGIMCRGFMTVSMNQDKKIKEMDKLIEVYRNEVLVDYITQQPSSKVFITYGSAHLPGVYKILKDKDPNWKIASVKWLRTIDSPKEYQKELNLSE